MNTMSLRLAALAGMAALYAGPVLAKDVAGVKCESPPPQHCSGGGCAQLIAAPGNAVESKTGRKFFLDYPCDLKPGEKVTFILNIHGGGSIGNWQRHYFPAMDFKDKHRLVIATPTAATAAPVRMWTGAADDAHLQNIVEMVYDQFGARNIKAFWLAGHSQGGMTSNRIVCTDFFRNKVDGWLSLSGGRIGPAQLSPKFGLGGGGRPAASPAASNANISQASGGTGARPGAAATPTCDMNYIFTTGDLEIAGLPETSPWAEKYGCAARVRRPDIVDDKPGWVYDTSRQGEPNPAWGRAARPGVAQVFVYPRCKGGMVVADVMRLDKGHTEGLEPKVTEELIRMMLAAPGGKAHRAPQAD
jgi:hypothetical protein